MAQWDPQARQLTAAYACSDDLQEIIKLMQDIGLRCQRIEKPQDLQALNPAIALLDASTTQHYNLNVWRKYAPSVMILAPINAGEGADLILPADQQTNGYQTEVCRKMIQLALQQWNLKEHSRQLSEKHRLGAQQLQELAAIGIALSAEKDLHTLLEKILTEGKKLAGCDAASLFLVNPTSPEERELVFKLALNDSVEVPFVERSFPIDDKSISGYVATHGCELNIADVYQIAPSAPYKFNYNFDDLAGYRCVSLLAIPMHNYRGEAVGVIEFINRKKDLRLPLLTPDQALDNTQPFEESTAVLLRALASQSAIAIEHFVLLESINCLFEGFVNASVAAIEQRDPTTSGHSFRVADLCIELAQCLQRSHLSRFRHTVMTDKDLKQLRYAALLHDFGKVGVRENVLTKSKKLWDWQLQEIKTRFNYLQERLHHRVYYELYTAQKKQGLSTAQEQQLLAHLTQEKQALEQMLQSIIDANEPALLEDAGLASLHEIRHYSNTWLNPDIPLIDDEELTALSIKRGSLTLNERQEIEAHVVHTLDFLKLIPWTPELANIPTIAGSHHEKLDGSGYPKHLNGDEIPLASRIMTVCDIYDALTASDRPYKKAISLERAFSILEDETGRGLLDPDLVRLFIDENIPQCLNEKSYPQAHSFNIPTYHHHVCDFDLHSGHH